MGSLLRLDTTYHSRVLFEGQDTYSPFKGGVTVDTYLIKDTEYVVSTVYQGEETLEDLLVRFTVEYLL